VNPLNCSEDAEEIMLELVCHTFIHPLRRPAMSPLITNPYHPRDDVRVFVQNVHDRFSPVEAKPPSQLAYVCSLHAKGRRPSPVLVELRLCPKQILNE